MAIHKKHLENGSWEYWSGGEEFWVTIFDSNGYRVKSVTYWRDATGEWSRAFETEAEAIRAGETTERY